MDALCPTVVTMPARAPIAIEVVRRSPAYCISTFRLSKSARNDREGGEGTRMETRGVDDVGEVDPSLHAGLGDLDMRDARRV